MRKAEKTFFVDNLSEELKTAKTVVLIDYSGLSMKLQQELKNRLKEKDAKMLVVKNTLFALAGKKANLPEETLTDSVLSGQTAIVVSEEEPIAPLSVLYKFVKEFEIPQFKVGIIEGRFQEKDSLITLSKLPSKEVLFAQVVGAVSAPLYNLVGTLQGNMQKLVFILNEYSKSQVPSSK